LRTRSFGSAASFVASSIGAPPIAVSSAAAPGSSVSSGRSAVAETTISPVSVAISR
jgi:hypothetical protein